jgi:putative phosphoribosyl transferase
VFALSDVMEQQFTDRRDAGRQLAGALGRFKGADAVLLALPRGGVPVGYELALALELPLDVFIVRKVGVPGHRELAMGAIASGGSRVLNQELIDELRIPARAVDAVVAEEERELVRREQLYAAGQRTPIGGRTAILVDDGLATGATMRAAILAVRQQQPSSVIVAVPVGAPSTCDELRQEADDLVCLRMPEPFQAVGLWYRRFDQTSDDEVRTLLDAARRRPLATR